MTADLHPDFIRLPLAHRALHDVGAGRPENSRAAIRAACDAGYGIEIDVQRSADDKAMVFHDYDLARLAEAEGALRDQTAEALGGIPLRGGDEGIPTLREALALVAGRVPLLIEIKDQDGDMGPDVGPLEAAVAQDLIQYKGPVAVMSFNPHSVAAMVEFAPHIARGLVTGSYDPDSWEHSPKVCDRLRGIPDYDRLGCTFISHEVADLGRDRVAELKSAGAHILCWTVRSPADEARARKVAENITFEKYRAAIPA